MRLQQFHLESLGHASYLVGDEASGEALILDPQRDVRGYLEAARERDLRIAYVLDTHGHNDYLSGVSEVVAHVPDVTVLAPGTEAIGYDHRPVRDGERLEMGDVTLEVLHTPGHTPEHVSLLLRDMSASEEPAVLLSGGALLVGDVARPDLLGGDAATRESAATMCDMLRTKILTLPDHVEVFPTHVAGSLCGGNIGQRLSTTIGYERRTNPLLARLSSDAPLLDGCLDLTDLPAVPPYWRRMRGRNLAGPSLVGTVPEPPALRVEAFASARGAGAVVLDGRRPEAFAGGHVPRSLNVGVGSSFPTWAGTVLPEDADVVMVLERSADLPTVTWDLLRIGYRPPVGWLAGGMEAWRTSGREVARLEQITAEDLRRQLDARTIELLDVRQPAEWREGHVEGAVFVTGGELPARLGDVPDNGPLAVMCGSGFRSSVSASLLLSTGREGVMTLMGGMEAWRASRYPAVTGGPPSE